MFLFHELPKLIKYQGISDILNKIEISVYKRHHLLLILFAFSVSELAKHEIYAKIGMH